MTDPLTQARERVAARYPDVTANGTTYPNVCARAILAGRWDSGSLVQAALREGGA